MELIAKLHEQKIPRIIIMGPLPYWDLGLPKAVLDYYRSNLHQIIPKRSSFRVDLTEFQFQQRFRDKIRELGLEYISTWDALCKGRECLTRTGDTAADLMSFDTMHLTLSGSNYVAQAIAPCLFPGLDIKAPPQSVGVAEPSRFCLSSN